MSAASPLLEDDKDAANGDGSGSVGVGLWKKARGVMMMVKVKRNAVQWSRDTKLMRNLKDEAAKRKFIIDIIIVITVLGVLMAMSKSCLFHMEAVGRWDHGHAYKFSYALSLTMIVFLLKVLLAPIHTMLKAKKDKPAPEVEETEPGSPEASPTWASRIMPWLLLVVFTTFEMLMATLSSLGLLYGAPTTIFVVFKSSKAVFMALMSVVILGRHLNPAQWSSLLVISAALLLSTVAEGKGGGKGKGEHELNLEGT
ncbi:unnamed protein product [Effrenium voratum]|nr:unnamed protein product [Effrenium voratum]